MRCDLFCAVVDNFGDIGICWRLSRQLVAEHQWQLCLWVDDLVSFQKICPDVDSRLTDQQVAGVRIRLWSSPLPPLSEQDRPDLLLDALACVAPESYLHWLAAGEKKPLWLNLEYLSAEDWVAGCHGLPSLHPTLALKKYFFFPGFSGNTGGLIREQHKVSQLSVLASDPQQQGEFWHRIGLTDAMQYQRKISVFAYSQPEIHHWLEQLATSEQSHLVLVPEGVLARELQQHYPKLATGRLDSGALSLRILPFVPQPDYDLLLACCDINFVRGEDSIIRAHWAGKPFIWQIYRQQDNAHQEKLQAFLQKFLEGAAPATAQAIQALYQAWELEQDISAAWQVYMQQLEQIQLHSLKWQQFLTGQQDLASNLVRFVENQLIIPRNFS
ncbi:elongation factor P maturation arginine rhamnosyltransferase EarP [Rheinheimera sp.]|uniref:elongation factor P maturation arginine rhamnosyltransferase EarP n=1 Tax=Rheinheimera sp. TaxID=1869214 RepID=UPI00307FC0EB